MLKLTILKLFNKIIKIIEKIHKNNIKTQNNFAKCKSKGVIIKHNKFIRPATKPTTLVSKVPKSYQPHLTWFEFLHIHNQANPPHIF